jgi:arabinofuranosyltransferase
LVRQINQVRPTVIDTQIDQAHINITLDRQQVFKPGDCLQASWSLSGIRAVSLNGKGQAGTGEKQLCVDITSLPEFLVTLQDGTSRLYRLNVDILVLEDKFWALVGASVVLLLAALYVVLPAPLVKRALSLRPRLHISSRAVIIATALLFILWAAYFIYETSSVLFDGNRYFALFDDAMISMRYAWNLAHGNGLVWNPGERVEGYTNLLMTLYMAIPNLLLDKPLAVLAIHISGVIFNLVIAVLCMLIIDYIARDQTPQHRAILRVFSFAAALAYYPMLYWSLLGMETGLLTLLVLLSILALFRYTESGSIKWLRLMTVSLGLAYLTRPDALMVAVPVILYLYYETRRAHSARETVRIVGTSLAVYALFPIGQTLFRLAYYGQIAPNTYVLKVEGMPLLERVSNGLNFVAPFLVSIMLVLLVLVGGLILNFRREKLVPLAVLVLLVVYQIYVGGDFVYLWRILTPAMPLILGLFAYDVLAALKTRWHQLSWQPIVLTTLAFAGAFLTVNQAFLPEMTFEKRPQYVPDHNTQFIRALILDQVTTPQASVGVIWAGIMPYYSERYAIDFLGKSDPYIARLPPGVGGVFRYIEMSSRPGHNKLDFYYSIETLQPTFIERCEYDDIDICDWVDEHYVYIEYLGVPFYLLKDSPDVYWDRVRALDDGG